MHTPVKSYNDTRLDVADHTYDIALLLWNVCNTKINLKHWLRLTRDGWGNWRI